MYRNRLRASTTEGRLGKPIPRSVHVVLVVFGVAMGILNIWFQGWGFAILAGAAPIGVAVVYYRPLWSRRWFWLVLSILTVLQIPLVVIAKPLMDQLKFLFLLGFVIVDFFFVAVVINVGFPKTQETDNR
jgi:hypothetical protein